MTKCKREVNKTNKANTQWADEGRRFAYYTFFFFFFTQHISDGNAFDITYHVNYAFEASKSPKSWKKYTNFNYQRKFGKQRLPQSIPSPPDSFSFFTLTAEMCRSFHISWFLGIRDRTRLNQPTFWSRKNHMESEPVGSDWVQTWSHISSNFDVSLSTFLCTFFTLMHMRCWQIYLKAGFDVLKYPSHYHPNDPTPQYWHTYSLI